MVRLYSVMAGTSARPMGGGEKWDAQDEPEKHSRVKDLLVCVERPRSVCPMYQDDQELGDRQKLPRIACRKAERRQQTESCATQARLFLRIKEEGI